MVDLVLKYLYEPAAYEPGPVPNNFWEFETPALDARIHPPDDDLDTDVAVIGAGYTGLCAAIGILQHGYSVCVLDRAFPGWGASGRNGGFVCLGGSMNSWQGLIKSFGKSAADEFHRTQREAIDRVAQNIDTMNLEVDRHSHGEWELAHNRNTMHRLKQESDFLYEAMGIKTHLYPREELANIGMAGPEFFGALHQPIGFAINPRKYLNGLANRVLDLGGRILSHSEVKQINEDPGGIELQLRTTRVRCRKLVVAVNGYAADDWIPGIDGRYLPAISAITVTRPLSDNELADQGWTTDQMAFDSRPLLHYFRLMPDRRFLFGGRGGTSYKAVAETKNKQVLRADFERMFPAWRDVETPWYWSGLVCLCTTANMYLGAVPGLKNAWTALGYHGNGIAMGSWSGSMLAGLVCGYRHERDIPAIMGQLKSFPLKSQRRLWLKSVYAWYALRQHIEFSK